MAKQKKRTSGPRELGDRPDNKKLKHGRQQLRNVTRTARRNVWEDRTVKEESESEGEAEVEPVAKENITIDSDQAYGALLTLLKQDVRKSKKEMKEEEEEDEEEDEEDEEDDDDEGEDKEQDNEIAGANVEDEEEVEEEEDVEDDDSDINILNDPFESHFNLPTDTYVDLQQKEVEKPWILKQKQTFDFDYSQLVHVTQGTPLPTIENPLKYLKKRIKDTKAYPAQFSNLDAEISKSMFNYQDINYAYKFYQNTSYRKLYVIHCLNHIFKTRDRIIKNTGKINHIQEQLKAGAKVDEPELRDQGFTRPKVLILLPTRDACYEIVELLIQLSGSEQQENKKKFVGQFYNKDVPPENKPNDFKDTFKGNNNDFFCLGMKFTRKSIKLYSSFYSSDIIIASPIGLSMILENEDKKKRQYDFVSSIEVMVIDKANQIENQNWDHVMTVLKYINKIPKDFHGVDFSRVRMWSINEQAKMFRQTLVFSEFQTPSINNIVTKSVNLAGRMKLKPVYNEQSCIMNSIGLKIPQVFHKFESANPMTDPESRFKFFTNTILPNLLKSTSYEDGIMIFIPSYYDYLRIKSHMKSHTKYDFAGIDEYTPQSKLDRIRNQFVAGKIKIVLYTERLHYFRRYEFGGVKSLFMYGIPSNPLFYREFIRFIGKSVFKQQVNIDLAVVKVIYSKWDMVSLERIVGNKRAPVLCNSTNDIYEFR